MEAYGGVPSLDRRIVGLVVRKRSGKQGICSGLWIAPNVIVTAGHCLCDGRQLVKQALVTNTEKFAAAGGSWIAATGITTYPDFLCDPREAVGTDLGLVFTEGEGPTSAARTTGSSAAKPQTLRLSGGRRVCDGYSLLQDIKQISIGFEQNPRTVSVGGFGSFKHGEGAIGERRVASLQINSPLCIGRTVRLLGCRSFREFIMSASEADWGKRDTCSGDSGGPAFAMKGEVMVPIGIVSRGLPIAGPLRRGACGAGGIYTHLGTPEALAWLQSNGVPRGKQVCVGGF